MLTRLIPFPPTPPGERQPHAGHFTDPLPGERPWVPIDGVMIRGFAGRNAGRASICGLEYGGRIRTQAMFDLPMESSTLQAIGETILALADLARKVEAQRAAGDDATAGQS